MLGRRFPFLTALCVGLTAGIGYPFVDLALACRVPISEACVWGQGLSSTDPQRKRSGLGRPSNGLALRRADMAASIARRCRLTGNSTRQTTTQ